MVFPKRHSRQQCDVCGGHKFTPFKSIEEHQYDRCNKCQTIVLSTRELNNQKPITYLDDPEGYLSILNPYGTRYMAGNVDHAYTTKVGAPKGRLLEIGAGLGFLSYTLFCRDWEVESLELSKAAADWSDRIFKLPVHTQMIEDYEPEANFDAVVLVEVMEHFYNPKLALKQIRKLMKPNGLIFGTTPNTASDHWKSSEQNIYEPSDHIVLFNAESLTQLLHEAGFKKVTVDLFGVGENNDSNLMYSGIR